MFLGPSAVQLRTKIDKKASPERPKIKQKIGQHLDPILDGFWNQLGSIFGGFWRPSWAQNRAEIGQKSVCKPVENMIENVLKKGSPRAASQGSQEN